eukprot:6213408-Pleurochrysis_carterae.AAC.1
MPPLALSVLVSTPFSCPFLRSAQAFCNFASSVHALSYHPNAPIFEFILWATFSSPFSCLSPFPIVPIFVRFLSNSRFSLKTFSGVSLQLPFPRLNPSVSRSYSIHPSLSRNVPSLASLQRRRRLRANRYYPRCAAPDAEAGPLLPSISRPPLHISCNVHMFSGSHSSFVCRILN